MHLLWNTLAKLVPWKCVLCGCPILVKSITSGAYLHLSVTVTKSKVLPLPAGSSLGGGEVQREAQVSAPCDQAQGVQEQYNGSILSKESMWPNRGKERLMDVCKHAANETWTITAS